MEKKSKLFTPDTSEENYTIKITAFKNCNTISIIPNGDYVPTYHEVIGVLEINRYNLIVQQTAINRKKAKSK